MGKPFGKPKTLGDGRKHTHDYHGNIDVVMRLKHEVIQYGFCAKEDIAITLNRADLRTLVRILRDAIEEIERLRGGAR